MMSASDQADFAALINYLKQNRGLDLTGYQPSSLMRRIHLRLQTIGINNINHYLDYLKIHAAEVDDLWHTILIHLTSFFRDRTTWEYLEHEAIPHLIAQKNWDEPIRIWSAGCASGEEAYSLAMLVTQIMGIEQAKARVKIYATDVDPVVLQQARQAVYRPEDLADLSAQQITQYFEPQANRYILRNDLRQLVVFGRHDLTQDLPIINIDFLVCRNTLIYFTPATQQQILNQFHFALRDSGLLLLGSTEMLLTLTNHFTPWHLQYGIFTKVPKLTQPDPQLTQADQQSNRDRVTDLRLAPTQATLNGQASIEIARQPDSHPPIFFTTRTLADTTSISSDLALSALKEELETMQEKLQSSHEALKLTQTELEATNRELEAMNVELQLTTQCLQSAQSALSINQRLLTGILTHFKQGVIAIDEQASIQIWSPQTTELWGIPAQVALKQNFFALDLKLSPEQDQQLTQALQQCLLGGARNTLIVTLSSNPYHCHPIHCQITYSPWITHQQLQGAIMVIDQLLPPT
ncbi:MAG: hypothetical protein MUF72_19930 [Elainella sp. Prado103]|nr:hypothetical protein [Elainella sp. Prado103]